jgi:hypothetical protein
VTDSVETSSSCDTTTSEPRGGHRERVRDRHRGKSRAKTGLDTTILAFAPPATRKEAPLYGERHPPPPRLNSDRADRGKAAALSRPPIISLISTERC